MEYKKEYIRKLLNKENNNIKNNISKEEMIEHFNSEQFNIFYKKLNRVFSKYWKNDNEEHYMNILNNKHNYSRHLFVKSFTHKSYFLDKPDQKYYYNYERNEFIGDSHLNYLVKRYVFNKYGKYGNENLLSKISTYMISKRFYKLLFDDIKLYPLIFYDKKIIITPSIKEDILESFFHSFYCNFGIKYTKCFLNKLLNKYKFEWILEQCIDYKTILNEVIFKKYNKPLKEVVEFSTKRNKKGEFICSGFKINGKFYKNKLFISNKNKNILIEEVSKYVLELL